MTIPYEQRDHVYRWTDRNTLQERWTLATVELLTDQAVTTPLESGRASVAIPHRILDEREEWRDMPNFDLSPLQ